MDNIEIVKLIYKDCDASISSLAILLKDLEDKDNKIKETIRNISKGYKRYLDKANSFLKEEKIEPEKMGFISKMMTNMGIDKNVKKDNSDASIADMLIKGIDMGVDNMNKKIKESKNLDENILKLSDEFKDFQQDNINALKKHL